MAELIYLPVAEIHPHPGNPRKDLGDLTELADSIKANGVLQNLTVVDGHTVTMEEHVAMCRREGVGKAAAQGCYEPGVHSPEGYTVIIGHRRLAAAKLAGLELVPCVIADLTPKEQARTMLMENIQRSDLTVYEQAQGFQLMMDMGETVESIARDSGFSQTTVRNRLDIAKLDPEKLRKVQGRQATMQDYIDLSKIEDMEVRNKVLEDIGTANFRNSLQAALSGQRIARLIERYEKEISAFATKAESVEYDRKSSVYIVDNDAVTKYVRNYLKWDMKEDVAVEVPDDADKVRYFYKVSVTQIDIYREVQADEAQKADEKKRREEIATVESEKRRAALEDIRDRHYRLRLDFVRNLRGIKTNAKNIQRMAALALIGNGAMYERLDLRNAADVLGFLMPRKFDSESELFAWLRGELVERAKEEPERTLLLMAFTRMDDPSQGYFFTQWRYPVYHYVHQENVRLSRLYDLLADMGYQMSDEERDMRDGTHELFEKPEEFEGEADNG